MLIRAAVVCALFAGCTKSDPKADPPTARSETPSEPKAQLAEAPLATTQHRTIPALPKYSDLNPPGVPRLTGDMHTDRGLSYVDEVVGTGRAPEKGKSIKVHYTGWLTDGTKFDSSRDRDEPIVLQFDTGQVIKGWDIGLASMRVGGKRRLVVPSELGYGDRGASDVIPPDSTLVFDVELVAAD